MTAIASRLLRGTLARRKRAGMLVTALVAAAVLPATGQTAHADTRDIRPPILGTAFAWGSNGAGQLGDGTTIVDSTTPGRVCGGAPCTGSLDNVVAVSPGDFHSLALRSDGSVVAWGANGSGQLGDGTNTQRNTPVRVCALGQTAPCSAFLSGVVAVAAGGQHSLALLADGTLVAWGGNGSGQLGDGTNTPRDTPVRVCALGQTAPCSTFLSGVVSIAAGISHTLAIQTSGATLTWGFNGSGQLGDGTTTARAVPVRACAVNGPAPCPVGPFLSSLAVSGGFQHSVALLPDRTVAAWGFNGNGELGNGTTNTSSHATRVCTMGTTGPCPVGPFLTGVASVAAGDNHSLAAFSDGSLAAWGFNGSGQLGNGTTGSSTTPVQVCAVGSCASGLSGVAAIGAGDGRSMALLSDGTVATWGANGGGQLGDGTRFTRFVPVQVCVLGATAPCSTFLSGVAAIGMGFTHALVVVDP